MANLSGNHHEGHQGPFSQSPVDGPAAVLMNQNFDFSVEWTFEEQILLQENIHLLASATSENRENRYAMIATLFNNKTIRDVALRCKWMALMEEQRNKTGKRRNVGGNPNTKNMRRKV